MNSTRGQTRFLACVARVTCLVTYKYSKLIGGNVVSTKNTILMKMSTLSRMPTTESVMNGLPIIKISIVIMYDRGRSVGVGLHINL